MENILRNHFLKLSALATLLVLAGCQSTPTSTSTSAQNDPLPPANPNYAGEIWKFNAQFPNAKALKYEDESLSFNNKHKLDEKGNCHDMSKHPVTIILVLDADGKVSSSTTDVSNGKAECFRQAYASAQFPRPPMAPYRKPIRLR